MVSVQKDQRKFQELSLHVLTDLKSQQNDRVSQNELNADDVTKYPKNMIKYSNYLLRSPKYEILRTPSTEQLLLKPTTMICWKLDPSASQT